MLAIAFLALGSLGALAGTTAQGAESSPARTVGHVGKGDHWDWTVLDARGLALGGGGLDGDDIRQLHAEGFRAVLNYRSEHPDDADALAQMDMAYLFVNTTHAEQDTMPIEDVHAAVAFIEAQLAAGNPVYAHCTGGWHRSAVGPVAFLMKQERLRADEAWERVRSLRPAIEPRFMDTLYEYEAWLFDEEKLTLDIWADRWDVAPNGTVEMTARVTRHGEPVPGAHVVVKRDYGAVQGEGLSDADGKFRVTYTAPAEAKLDYVHAIARQEGFLPGYDRNQFWVKTDKVKAPIVLKLDAETYTVDAGTNVTIPIHVREETDKATNARVTITSPGATHFRDWTGWDGAMDATFRAPDVAGEYRLLLTANRFPVEPVQRTVTLIVTGEPPPPTPGPDRTSGLAPTPITRGSGVEGDYSVPLPGGAPLAALAACALLLGRRRLHR